MASVQPSCSPAFSTAAVDSLFGAARPAGALVCLFIYLTFFDAKVKQIKHY